MYNSNNHKPNNHKPNNHKPNNHKPNNHKPNASLLDDISPNLYRVKRNSPEFKDLCERFPRHGYMNECYIHRPIINMGSATGAIIVPYGNKYFAWFTYFRDIDSACILMQIKKDKCTILSISPVRCSFNHRLCTGVGTVLYGTLVDGAKKKNGYNNTHLHSGHENTSPFFYIEDIKYYCGELLDNNTWDNKMQYYTHMRNHSELCDFNKCLRFSFPQQLSSVEEIQQHIYKLPYNVYAVQYINIHKRTNKRKTILTQEFLKLCNTNSDNSKSGQMYTNTQRTTQKTRHSHNTQPYNGEGICKGCRKTVIQCRCVSMNNTSITELQQVFTIKADIQSDIYYIITDNIPCNVKSRLEIPTGYREEILHIPNYTLSVFMNTIFRNIKENRNLDLLEESDSEEEFENIDEDRFVDLEKSERILCKWNKYFRRWVPISQYSE
jgi:hypothetical protein